MYFTVCPRVTPVSSCGERNIRMTPASCDVRASGLNVEVTHGACIGTLTPVRPTRTLTGGSVHGGRAAACKHDALLPARR